MFLENTDTFYFLLILWRENSWAAEGSALTGRSITIRRRTLTAPCSGESLASSRHLPGGSSQHISLSHKSRRRRQNSSWSKDEKERLRMCFPHLYSRAPETEPSISHKVLMVYWFPRLTAQGSPSTDTASYYPLA